MQKREKIMLGVTLSAALIFVVNQFFLSEPPKQPAKKNKAVPVSRTQPVSGEKISNEELQKRLQNWKPVVEYDSWGQDPFKGSERLAIMDTSSDSTNTHLSGIVWSENSALAIIGDRIVRQGDSVDDVQILRIYEDRVLARRGNNLIKLQLGQDIGNGKNDKEAAISH